MNAAKPSGAEPAAEQPFISEKELLKRIPVCRRTLYDWVQKGIIPSIKIGRRRIYHWETVKQALLRIQKGEPAYDSKN